MIYTFGMLPRRIVSKETMEIMGKVMMNGIRNRVEEELKEKYIPFLLIAGKPNEYEVGTTLEWFFPEELNWDVEVSIGDNWWETSQ